MGWSPKVNFSLRDDEVTFGNLIMDKNTAETLCQALVNIKNGMQVDVFPQILQYVYTDDEFSKVREEFQLIKEDIKYFGELLKSKGKVMPGIANAIGRMTSTFDYVVGTTSWIEKYKSYISIAGEAYSQLLAMGHQFPPEEASTYSKRYGEVLANTTDKERIRTSIENQFRDDLKELGPEQALRNKIQNEKNAGIVNEGTSQMLDALVVSMGEAKQKGADEANSYRDAMDEQREIMASAVQEISEKEKNAIVITADMVIDLWRTALDRTLANGNRLQALARIGSEIISLTDVVGFISVINSDSVKAYAEGNTDDHDICSDVFAAADKLVQDLTFKSNAELFDSVEITVDKDEWYGLLPAPHNVTQFRGLKSAANSDDNESIDIQDIQGSAADGG